MTATAVMKVKIIPDTSELDRAVKKSSKISVPMGGAGSGGGMGGAAGFLGDVVKGMGKGLAQGVMAGGGIALGLAVTNKLLEIITNAMQGIARVVSAIQKVIEAALTPLMNLMFPLLIPILTGIAPLVRVMNLLFRPVLQKMMEGMKAGMEAKGPLGAFTGALGAGIEAMAELTYNIFTTAIYAIGQIFMDVVITPLQAIIVMLGIMAKMIAGLFVPILSFIGIDTTGLMEGITAGIGDVVVNLVSGLEVFKQLNQVFLELQAAQSIQAFSNIMTGLETPVLEMNNALTLTQGILVGMAGAISPETAANLTSGFKAINTTTESLKTLFAALPTDDMNEKFTIFNDTFKTFVDNIIAGKDPVTAYSDAVKSSWEAATTADTNISKLSESMNGISSAQAVSEIAKLQAAMDSLHAPEGAGEGSTGGWASGDWAGGFSDMLSGGGGFRGGATLMDRVMTGIGGAFLGGLALGPVGAVAGGLLGASNPVKAGAFGDFIMRPGQEPVAFSSGDTVIGTKNPEGGKIEINMPINIQGQSGLTQGQIDKILQEVNYRLQSQKMGAGGF